MHKIIYLDNASTTKMNKSAFEAMQPYFCKNYGNAASAHSMGRNAKNAVENARFQLASIINARPEEIYFTSGGTESDNWALKMTADALKDQGHHIITSSIEHHAVLNTCEKLKDEGFDITYLTVDETGKIRPEDLENAIRDDTILISIMAANNEIGTIEPVRSIGHIAKKHHILFHSDIVQAFGHIPINVTDFMMDMASVSAHKFGGPKGCGFLYIKKGTPISSFMEGGAQENGMRAGTSNVPGIVGMGVAAMISANEMNNNNRIMIPLRDRLIERITTEIPGVRLTGHRKNRLPNNASFCFERINTIKLLQYLDKAGICASAGSACTTGSINPSHVLIALGIPYDTAKNSLRLTLSKETTEEEIDYTIETIKKLCR